MIAKWDCITHPLYNRWWANNYDCFRFTMFASWDLWKWTVECSQSILKTVITRCKFLTAGSSRNTLCITHQWLSRSPGQRSCDNCMQNSTIALGLPHLTATVLILKGRPRHDLHLHVGPTTGHRFVEWSKSRTCSWFSESNQIAWGHFVWFTCEWFSLGYRVPPQVNP